jgi:anti-sigma factor RsiW
MAVMAGPTKTEIDPERAEIEALLPWYVSGTLSLEEEARVARYVEAHPEMAALVELTRAERAETIAGNEAIGMPSRHALDRLMARVAEAERAKGVVPRVAAKGSLLTRIVDGFADLVQSLAPRQLAFAAAAALALIVAQGVTLGVMMGPNAPGGFSTASGDKEATAAGTFALVRFAPAATAAAIADMLLDLEASIVDGPKAGGIYRLRLAAVGLDEGAAKARLTRLQARSDLVTFAALTR